MKVTALRTVPLWVPADPPVRAAIFEITGFGCLAVFLETDAGPVGESLVFEAEAGMFPINPAAMARHRDVRHGAIIDLQSGPIGP